MANTTNSGQKNTLSGSQGNFSKQLEYNTTKRCNLKPSVAASFSKIKKNGEVLTKKVSMVDSEVYSDASECRMSRGRAEKTQLTLDKLPEFLSALKSNEAITTGWVNSTKNEYEIVPKEKYLEMGAEFPAAHLEHGNYSTRTKESFSQEGHSLIMFDYDYDETAELQIESPEHFIKLLSEVIPHFDKICYVRTFSTSSAIYHKETGKCLREAEGFHLYMVVEDGSDLQDFGERLNQRLWLKGYGHIKVSKSAALLKRTLVDTAVFSPERLIFEAGAVLSPELEQRLPKPQYVKRPLAMLDTRSVKKLSAKEAQELLVQEKIVKSSESVLAKQAEIRKQLVLELIAKQKAEGKDISLRQAEHVIEAKTQFKLTYDTTVEFESGEVITVAELLFRAEEFDRQLCLDPLREDKGFGKVQFYANTDSGMPVIHSFVEGGRVYKLHEAVSLEEEIDQTCYVKDFEKLWGVVKVQDNRYLEVNDIHEGLTVIRSQKGTGKTFGVANWLKQNDSLKVLNVTHRVSLARSLGTKFGNDIYNDESMTIDKLVTSNRLSCCYDSVHKLSRQQYDVVIMDEAVQIMRHIVADTVREKFLALNVLMNIILNAKYVIMMDADFQAFHVEFLQSMKVIAQSKQLNVELNIHQPAKGHQIDLLVDSDGRGDELTLLERMATAAKQSGIFYASNSVKDVELKAEQIIQELGHTVRVQKGDFMLEIDNRRVIIISGNNSGNAEVQEFIDNINTNLREDDLVFCSPSMGTGVSIDAVEGAPVFPEVFARFTKRAGNIPSDCLQHMSRVRECTKYSIVIVDDASYECTDADQIVEQRLLTAVKLVDSKTNPFHHCLNFNSWTGQYEWGDSGYAQWVGFIKGMEAQERNLFGDHLKIQLAQEGYDVTTRMLHIETEMSGGRKALKDRVKAQKAAAKELELQLKRDTELIDDQTYKNLKGRKNLRIADRRKVEKKYYAEIMGLRKKSEVDNFICDSEANIKNRIGGLIFGMNSDSLLVKELSDRVNSNKQHLEKSVDFERQQLAFEIAAHIGVTLEGKKVVSDERIIDEDLINKLYNILSGRSNICKRLFGLSVPLVSDITKRSQKILTLVKKLGIKTCRLSVRLADKTIGKVRKICPESIIQINKDIKTASKYSVLAGFNEPKPTGDLEEFLLYNQVGLSHLSKKVHNYLMSLAPEFRERLEKIFNMTGNNNLQPPIELGEPQ